MPDYKNSYPMVLNGVFIGMISLRSDQVDYFGIPEATPAELAFTKYTGEIAGHTRKIRTRRLEANSPIREVTVGKKTGVGRERGKQITKKPKSFQSPAGKTYSVSPLPVGAIVTGEDTTP